MASDEDYKTWQLSDIASYKSQNIDCGELPLECYVSTENMLPNKAGIVSATKKPEYGNAKAFDVGDILVSNIRPYFKKIWRASFSGGSSPDVLVITAKEETYPRFLYYVLSQDSFFDYSTASSKGTKMPRGDKAAILNYVVPYFQIETQRKIAAILGALDDKIETNDRIIKNLQEQRQVVYSHFKSMISNGDVVCLDDLAFIDNKSFNPKLEPEQIVEHYSIPAFDQSQFPVFEVSTAIKSNKYKVNENCVLVSKLNPNIKRVWRPYGITDAAICSTEFVVIRPRNEELFDYLHAVVDNIDFHDFIQGRVNGTTGSRQRVSPTAMLEYGFVMLPPEEIKRFTSISRPMFRQIRALSIENRQLAQLRDTLLPRLMSGELDVSEVSLDDSELTPISSKVTANA